VALCDVAGVCLVNLQKDILPQELAVFSGRPNFIDVSGMLHDFADTAAVLANLDLVLAVDTAVVHLAGAMGRRAWVMLPYVPDWRWMQHRDDSPWYPGLKLFRQQVFGSWAGCLERVVAALRLELEA
ncbi:MAG TPA: hypothetical protein HPQ00_08530, partial [Magnetococcales bacterium]|nr:hypothetical protein [Magnetococcales bacterium]